MDRSISLQFGWARAGFGLLGGLLVATLLAVLTGLCWPASPLARVFAIAITLPIYWSLAMVLCFAARRLARMGWWLLLVVLLLTAAIVAVW